MSEDNDCKAAETIGPEDLIAAQESYKRVSHLVDELGTRALCVSAYLGGLEAGRPQWRSVSDELPKISPATPDSPRSDAVPVIINDTFLAIASYDHEKKAWYDGDWIGAVEISIAGVTHWCPGIYMPPAKGATAPTTQQTSDDQSGLSYAPAEVGRIPCSPSGGDSGANMKPFRAWVAWHPETGKLVDIALSRGSCESRLTGVRGFDFDKYEEMIATQEAELNDLKQKGYRVIRVEVKPVEGAE